MPKGKGKGSYAWYCGACGCGNHDGRHYCYGCGVARMDPGLSAKGRFKAPPAARGSSAAPPPPPPPKGAGYGGNAP
eukprot:5727856-Prorocentrum_lima.AAC.1